jgi:hypothetical protein
MRAANGAGGGAEVAETVGAPGAGLLAPGWPLNKSASLIPRIKPQNFTADNFGFALQGRSSRCKRRQ